MLKKIMIAGWLALSSLGSAWAGTLLQATVDTGSLAGQTGWLDFQFNPADFSAPAASARISAFAADGTLLSATTATGEVSGNLSSALLLGNGQMLNDWLQGFVFGSSLQFLLDIEVPTPNSSGSGTAFSLSLYDSAFNSLLADPAWGAALVVNANDNGSVDILGQSAQVGLSTPSANSVPEPQTLSLLLAGLAVLGRPWRKLRPHASSTPLSRL